MLLSKRCWSSSPLATPTLSRRRARGRPAHSRGASNPCDAEAWAAGPGRARACRRGPSQDADESMDRLERLGVDLTHVAAVLEEQEVAAFTDCYKSLLATLAAKRPQVTGL